MYVCNTVTDVYYAGLIHKLCEVIKEKRWGKLTQGDTVTMTVHRHTPLMLPRPLYMTLASTSSHTDLIHQIHQISTCSDI